MSAYPIGGKVLPSPASALIGVHRRPRLSFAGCWAADKHGFTRMQWSEVHDPKSVKHTLPLFDLFFRSLCRRPFFLTRRRSAGIPASG